MRSIEVVAGDVIIEWPKGPGCGPHGTRITNYATGEAMPTVTKLTLYADCDTGHIHVDLTMLSDADGRATPGPIPAGNGQFWTATRRWRVVEFR